MKASIQVWALAGWGCIAGQQAAYGQACQKMDIVKTPAQQQVLRQFVAECRQQRYFIEDKGVVALTTYQDAKGQHNWTLYALVDDRYKDNPPRAYCEWQGELIFIYPADSTGRTQPASATERASRGTCLEAVVAGRLYQRPPARERYVEAVGPDGKPKKYLVRTMQGGNIWNSQRVIFKPDGTFTILRGV